MSDSNPPETAVTPTITYFQQLATDFMKQMDVMTAAIPDVEEKHPSTAKFVHGHQNVPDAFIVSAVATMEQTPSLHGVDGLDPVVSRSDLQFNDAFKQVVDKLTALRNALQYTIRTKRANLAAAALQTYYLTKGIARNRTNAAVLSHVTNMKRDLGKRGRVRKSDPQPQPAPQTPEGPEPNGNAPQA